MDQNDVLVSDAERQRSIAELRDACAHGRLTLDEFSSRVNVALAARTLGALVALTRDLPSTGSIEPRARTATRWSVAVLGSVKRNLRWRVDHSTVAISLLGSCDLDLRRALVEGSEVTVNAFAFLGSVKITVPAGTDVDMEGPAILGSSECKIDPTTTVPGSPLVRVRAFVLLGSVEVVEKRPKSLPEAGIAFA